MKTNYHCKSHSKSVIRKRLYVFTGLFLILLCFSLIYFEASVSRFVYCSCNNGKISIENSEENHLYLKYDDFYSLRDNGNYPGYNNYAIVEIKSTGIRSYKVSKGSITNKKDSAVLERDSKNTQLGLHAVGVGTAEVLLVKSSYTETATKIINGTYNGSSVNITAKRIRVTVNPARLTVMLLTGQSNMSGSYDTSGSHPENSIVCPRGQVYSSYPPFSQSSLRRYTGLSGEAATVENMSSHIAGSLNQKALAIDGNSLIYKLNSLTEDGQGKTGPDGGLAYEYNKLSGDKVWIINMAVGATGIDHWDPKGTESGPMWLRTKTAYKLIEKTYQAEIKAKHFTQGNTLIFWLQGEADYKKSINYYQKKFDNLYSEAEALIHPDYWGIISVRGVGTPTDKTDLAMTAPRIVQRYITSGYNSKYSNVYMASDINELWVTDKNVSDYFKETYPSGFLNYPLRSKATIRTLPTTVAEVHGNIHYSQTGHNENGIDAAYNMYHIVNGTDLFDSSAKVKGKNGKILSENPAVKVQIINSNGLPSSSSNQFKALVGEEMTLSLKASPTYMTKSVHLNLTSDTAFYKPAHQAIQSSENIVETVYALTPFNNSIASVSIKFAGVISPKIESISCNNNNVVLTWKNNIKAIGGKYNIYRTSDLKNWSNPIGTVILDESSYTKETLQFTDSKATTGDYYYAVESFCDSIAGGITSYTKVTYYDAPKLKTVCGNSSGITVTWESADSTKSYRVFRKTDGGSWCRIGNTTSKSFTDKNVTPGVTYTYTVRCMKEDFTAYTSGYDTTGISLKYAAAPELKYYKIYSGTITIVWDEAKGAEVYRVFKKTKGSSYKQIGDTTATRFKDSDVKSGVTYYYTVRCMDSKKKVYTSGYNVNGIKVTYQ